MSIRGNCHWQANDPPVAGFPEGPKFYQVSLIRPWFWPTLASIVPDCPPFETQIDTLL